MVGDYIMRSSVIEAFVTRSPKVSPGSWKPQHASATGDKGVRSAGRTLGRGRLARFRLRAGLGPMTTAASVEIDGRRYFGVNWGRNQLRRLPRFYGMRIPAEQGIKMKK